MLEKKPIMKDENVVIAADPEIKKKPRKPKANPYLSAEVIAESKKYNNAVGNYSKQ